MTPKIKKQKKLFVSTGAPEPPSFSRLEATAVAEIPMTVSRLMSQSAALTDCNFRMSLKTGTRTISKLAGTRSTTRARSNWFAIRERKSAPPSINLNMRPRWDRTSGTSMTKCHAMCCAKKLKWKKKLIVTFLGLFLLFLWAQSHHRENVLDTSLLDFNFLWKKKLSYEECKKK